MHQLNIPADSNILPTTITTLLHPYTHLLKDNITKATMPIRATLEVNSKVWSCSNRKILTPGVASLYTRHLLALHQTKGKEMVLSDRCFPTALRYAPVRIMIFLARWKKLGLGNISDRRQYEIFTYLMSVISKESQITIMFYIYKVSIALNYFFCGVTLDALGRVLGKIPRSTYLDNLLRTMY